MHNPISLPHKPRMDRSIRYLTLGGALAAVLALSVPMALAQGAPAFADVDFNVDGVISQDEFLAAIPGMTAEDFELADLNADTILTEEEFVTMAAEKQ